MKGVERTNAVIVSPNQWAELVSQCNPYTIEIDQGKNCYSCRGFRHLVRNCRNRDRIGQERRIEYGNNLNNRQRNLNGEKNLIVLD